MGKRNDRRRRLAEAQARARKRARTNDRSGRRRPSATGSGSGAEWPGSHGGPGANGAAAPGSGGRPFTPDLIDDVISIAVGAARAYDGRSVDNAVTVLTRGPVVGGVAGGPAGQAAVDRALGRHLVEAVGDAWGRGWQPADLVRAIERRLGRAHRRLAVTAIVHDTARYEPAAVPPRWRAQVDELAATVAHRAAGNGNGTRGGVGHAADGDRWAVPVPDGDRRSAVMTAVETLAIVRWLPDVPKLGPAPGDAAVASPAGAAGGAGGHADPRILHRVRSLLAKAESTTFPEEAEALTAKAQQLMARHTIDAAVVEAERGTGPDVAARRLAVDDPYAAPKAILLDAIASANRCRSVWSKGYGYATVFGAEGDLDAVELLYTSLLVQAARAMLSEGPGSSGGSRGGGRTRSFRQSFLVAFATRIGARLREAVETATDEYADQHDNLLPVLAERRDAAEAACEEAFPHVRSTSVSANDWWGWRAGNEAAEAAQLDLHAAVGGAAP